MTGAREVPPKCESALGGAGNDSTWCRRGDRGGSLRFAFHWDAFAEFPRDGFAKSLKCGCVVEPAGQPAFTPERGDAAGAIAELVRMLDVPRKCRRPTEQDVTGLRAKPDAENAAALMV